MEYGYATLPVFLSNRMQALRLITLITFKQNEFCKVMSQKTFKVSF